MAASPGLGGRSDLLKITMTHPDRMIEFNMFLLLKYFEIIKPAATNVVDGLIYGREVGGFLNKETELL